MAQLDATKKYSASIDKTPGYTKRGFVLFVIKYKTIRIRTIDKNQKSS
jgi:hypothetical protein